MTNTVLLCSVAWIVLLLELIFEVSIRPKNFRQLLEKEEAYSPKTVRHINRFHLAFEFIALLSVIPDFLPLFIHERITTLSFTQAAIAASQGASTGEFILGHLYFLLLHLRLFGLIRHKRNHWIQPHVDEILDDSKESSEKDVSRPDFYETYSFCVEFLNLFNVTTEEEW